MATPLRVAAPFHSIFYTPLFVAKHLGAFEAEGLDVSIHPTPPNGVMAGLLEGAVDVGVSGPMRALELADRGTGKSMISFLVVNARSGFFLLGRSPAPDEFSWPDLKGKVVISFAEAPTPWLCLQHILRREGVDPGAVAVVRNHPTPAAIARFRAGFGDFIEQPMPGAQQLLDEGVAYQAASQAEAIGPVAFSAYLATPAFLEVRRETALAFARAHLAAAAWICDHSAREIALLLAPSFPGLDPGLRQKSIERYKQQNTWPTDGIIGEAEFELLQDILVGAAFIRRRFDYSRLVNTAIARQAAEELGGPVS